MIFRVIIILRNLMNHYTPQVLSPCLTYYSRISVLGLEGHCTGCFKESDVYFKSTACEHPQRGGSQSQVVRERVKKNLEFLLKVINGWPLTVPIKCNHKTAIFTDVQQPAQNMSNQAMLNLRKTFLRTK